MRDPITKLAIVTQETCAPALARALGPRIISSARPEKPDDTEVVVNVVHFAGKVVRKSRGVMGGSDPQIMVIGDQAIYLHKNGDGELRRCVPVSAVASVHVYAGSHIVLRIPTEYDLLLQIEGAAPAGAAAAPASPAGGAKDGAAAGAAASAAGKDVPEVGFVVNVLTVLQEVLYGRKLPAKKGEGNPLDDKDINLKKPDAFQEVNVPLTTLRVPLLKSDTAVENVIRPHAPAATNLQPLTFETFNKELSPRAKALLDHPLLVSNRRDEDEDEDDTSGSEAGASSRHNQQQQQQQAQAQQHSASRRLSADAPADDSTDNNSDTNTKPSLAPPVPVAAVPARPAAIVLSADGASAPVPAAPTAPSPTYSPAAAPPAGILRRPPPLPPGVTPEMARQEEELRRKNDELTRRLKQIEGMQRAVEQQQVQAMEMVDYVQRITKGVAAPAPAPAAPGADAAATPGPASAAADVSTSSAAAASLPSRLRDVPPAPPSLLSEPRRSPGGAAAAADDGAADKSAALSAYYAAGSLRGGAAAVKSSSSATPASRAPPHAVAAPVAVAPSQPAPVALSPQDLQDEVVRRVRNAEEMFAARPPAERNIFRTFHIEQRQRYLGDLQAAVANPAAHRAPAPGFAHFNFASSTSPAAASERPFPLAVDVFLTQQELLYLLRIAQAEAPQHPAGGVMRMDDPWGGGGGGGAAGDNVFAANPQYAVPTHDPSAVTAPPLEPLAAHSSPVPRDHLQQQQQQMYRGAPQPVYGQPQQPPQQQWAQQPAQPVRASPQPRQPVGRSSMPQQPVQPVQPVASSSSSALRKNVSRRL